MSRKCLRTGPPSLWKRSDPSPHLSSTRSAPVRGAGDGSPAIGSMIQKCLTALLFLCVLVSFNAAKAQHRKILSPRDSVVFAVDTNIVSISYSRPSMRGRVIMGDLIPWGRVWRTGAKQATHLRTTFDMVLGGMPVPRGTYTVWTIPGKKGWTMILNKQTGQWGTQYDERQDLARFPVAMRHIAAQVDTFSISIERGKGVSGSIVLRWENTRISVPFERRTHLPTRSPTDSSFARLGGGRLAIRYGRPAVRGRTIWGVVVPWDSVWRTGANLSTAFTTSTDIRIGGTRIPKGSYTLYSIPSQDRFTLIISTRAPGTLPEYDSRLDLVRIPMTGGLTQKTLDRLTIWFDARHGEAVRLNLGWSNRTYSVRLSTR